MAKKHNTTADSAVDLDNETVFILHPQIDQGGLAGQHVPQSSGGGA